MTDTIKVLGQLAAAATTDPGVGDDDVDGYAIGSRWINITGERIRQVGREQRQRWEYDQERRHYLGTGIRVVVITAITKIRNEALILEDTLAHRNNT